MCGFRILVPVAKGVAMTFAGATTLLCSLTAVDILDPICAEKVRLQHWSSSGLDACIVLPLMAWLVVLMVSKAAADPRAREIHEGDVVLFEFRTFRLTDGMILMYSVLFGMAGTIGLLAFGALKGHEAVTGLCNPV